MLVIMYVGASLFGLGLIASLASMISEKERKWPLIVLAIGFLSVVIPYIIGA